MRFSFRNVALGATHFPAVSYDILLPAGSECAELVPLQPPAGSAATKGEFDDDDGDKVVQRCRRALPERPMHTSQRTRSFVHVRVACIHAHV